MQPHNKKHRMAQKLASKKIIKSQASKTSYDEKLAEIIQRATQQRDAGLNKSPFARQTSLPEQGEALASAINTTDSTVIRIAKYHDEIQKRFSIKSVDTRGSNVRFTTSQGKISLPLLGPVYSRTKGEVSGYQGAVNLIRWGENGTKIQTAEEIIMDSIRTGRDLKAIRETVASTHSYLRHKDASPYMRGSDAMRNSMDMMTQGQYRVAADQSIPVAALSERAQKVAGKMGISEFRFGGSSLQGKRHGSFRSINDIQKMGVFIPEILGHVRQQTGMDLHWDPMSDHGPLAGRFTNFGAADIDPFGNVQKAGAKHAQQFRTIGLNTDAMGGYAKAVGALGTSQDRGALFAGRALRTHLERQGAAQAARMDPSLALAAGSPDIVSGLNVRGSLIFGSAANQFPEAESIVASKQLMSTFRKGTGVSSLGISTPAFTSSTGKGNIIQIGGDILGGGHTARAGYFKTGAELTRSMMYGYVGAGLQKGHSWEAVTGALRNSMGAAGYGFLPGSHEAVLKQGEQLFMNMDSDAAIKQSMGMLRSFGNELGVSTKDFVHRDAAGNIVRMDVLEHIGIREQALSKAKSHLTTGTGFKGQKIAQNYASIFRGLGAPDLAEVFSKARQNPEMMKALDFRKNVLGTLGHLIDPDFKGGKIRGDVNRMNIDQLRFEVKGKATAVDALLSEYGPSDARSGYGGLAQAMKKQGILPQLFNGQGFHLDLGANVPIYDTLDKTYASAPMRGAVSEIAIPNLQDTNIADDLAYRMLRMAKGDDVGWHAEGLSKSLLGQYLGGKQSLVSKLASPRVGSELIHTVQKATMLEGKEYQQLVGEYFDNLHGAGRITAEQRRAIDPSKQRYAFVSGDRANDLSLQHRAILAKQKFLKTIATRDPVGGRGMAMRVAFGEEEYMPSKLKGLLGTQGIVTGPSDVNFMYGDTDFDTIRTLLAEGIEGDSMTGKMMAGFHALETEQAKALNFLDIDTARKVRLERSKKGEVLVDDFIKGLEGKDASPELRKLFAATMGTANREASILASTGLKALTGPSHGHALHRQIVSEAMTSVGESPFTSKTVSRYYSQDYLQGMQQLFISKHNVEGKQSLQMIKDISDITHGIAEARRGGGIGAAQLESKYEEARTMVRNMMLEIHVVAGGETNMAYSGGHAGELFGMQSTDLERIGVDITDRAAMGTALKSGVGANTVEQILEAEISMAENMKWMNSTYLPNARNILGPGGQYKDAYSTEGLLAQLDTLHHRIEPGATQSQRAIASMMGAHMEAGVETVDNAAAQAAADAAADFKSKIGGATPTPTRGDIKGIAKGVQDAVLDSIGKHPVKYGLAGIVAGGMLLLGGLNSAGRKVDQWTTPAGQETGTPMSPRSEYFVPEDSMLGHQLNGTMSLPPNAMPAMIQGFNRTDPRADIRVMDSRVGLSDRVLGYDAENTMSSLYARKQI